MTVSLVNSATIVGECRNGAAVKRRKTEFMQGFRDE
jgi:hypothetical protein